VFAFHSFSFLDTCTQNSVAAAPAQRIAAGTRRALLLTAVVGYCWWVVEVDACLNSRRGLAAMRTRRPITTLISMLLRRLVVLAMVPALSPVGAAHARPLTTAPGLTITIHVTITDTRIALKPDKAPRGVEARFVIKNLGAKPHNFTLNGKTVPLACYNGSAGRSIRTSRRSCGSSSTAAPGSHTLAAWRPIGPSRACTASSSSIDAQNGGQVLRRRTAASSARRRRLTVE
jgi:hypothetical protein